MPIVLSRTLFLYPSHSLQTFISYWVTILLHYAMKIWRSSFRGTWHLYGHSHGSLPDDPNSLSFDVGVDCHDYYPISYKEVKAIMAKKTWTPPFGDRT